MYAIEQTCAQGNQEQFKKSVGASLHYIDEQVDVGLLIATKPLINLWHFETIWQIKAASYMAAFDLLADYITQPAPFSFKDAAPYTEKMGPVFKASDLTEAIKNQAEYQFVQMRRQALKAPKK